MTYEEIQSRLKELICSSLAVKPDAIARSTRFDTDLGADPLDVIEIIMTCEDEWGVHITEDEAESTATFGALVRLVDNKLNGKRNGIDAR